jgi:DNA-binding transcriptional LysR family regulator
MMDIDLNLLRIFDILYDERNVTRAAARLFLTQSAVSHALARLRDVLGDPLFMRIPSGLQPTERAHQLAPRLRVALAEIRSAVATPVFDPAKTRQRFVISAGSYFCALIVPTLVRLAHQFAPGISLQFVNVGTELVHALDQQRVDLALSAFDKIPARFRSEVLFSDEKVWAIGTHHPLARQPFDHAALLAWPRLAIGIASAADQSREPPTRSDLVLRLILETDDEAISPRSARRTSPSMMVYDSATALAVIAATDLVTLVPRRFAKACASSTRIRIIEFPRDQAETIELSMLWHSRVHDDPGSLWLRALVRQAVNLSLAGLPPPGSVKSTSASANAARKAKRMPARTGSYRANRAAGN